MLIIKKRKGETTEEIESGKYENTWKKSNLQTPENIRSRYHQVNRDVRKSSKGVSQKN